MATFELTKTSNGEFRFSLKTADGRTLLSSETYAAKESATNGIASVQKNCGDDARYERKTSSNGKPFFNLKAANHQVIGTSPMFGSEADCEAAIATCKAEGASATVHDAT